MLRLWTMAGGNRPGSSKSGERTLRAADLQTMKKGSAQRAATSTPLRTALLSPGSRPGNRLKASGRFGLPA